VNVDYCSGELCIGMLLLSDDDGVMVRPDIVLLRHCLPSIFDQVMIPVLMKDELPNVMAVLTGDR